MSTGDVLRVAVDVTPRLFSDALARALAHHHVEIVPLPEAREVATEDRLDVVVTSQAPRDDLPPEVLIVRVSPGSGASSTSTSSGEVASPRVRTLEDLVAVIRRFAGPMGLTAT